MVDKYTGYYDGEAPEMSDAEIEEAYLDSLEQTAPEINWDECYCDEDNICLHCDDALRAKHNGFRRAA